VHKSRDRGRLLCRCCQTAPAFADTEDGFIADLPVGRLWPAEVRSPARAERAARCTWLIEIEAMSSARKLLTLGQSGRTRSRYPRVSCAS
jgi:hypothetical protein